MRKTIIVTSLACLVLSLAFSSALAQPDNDPVYIIPYLSEEHVYVNPNQDIILGARWGACRPGLVQASLPVIHLDWEINGVTLFDPQHDVAQYWGAIEQDYSFDTSLCKMKTEAIWLSYWRYELGQLDVDNNYVINLVYSLDRPRIDGIDEDLDGRPDIYQGTLQDSTITIHVVEP